MFYEKQRAEICRNGIKSAAGDDAYTFLSGSLVLAINDAADPGSLARNVHVMAVELHAGIYQWISADRKGARGGSNDTGFLDHRANSVLITGIRYEYINGAPAILSELIT